MSELVTLLDAAHAAVSADPENEVLRLRFYARLAESLLDQLGIGHCHWLGTSMGGAIDAIPRWMGVCYSALGMMGMLEPVATSIAQLEIEPPAAGKKRVSKARTKTKAKSKSNSKVTTKGASPLR